MERIAVFRELFGQGPSTPEGGTGAATGLCCFAANWPAQWDSENSGLTEADCRKLWEVPACENLLLQASCAARSSSGSARGPGRLFVFENAWNFASARPTKPQRRYESY